MPTQEAAARWRPIGYDAAVRLLAEDGGTKYAVRRVGEETFTLVTIEGVKRGDLLGATFDTLWRAGVIKRAPEYDTDAGVIYVNRDFNPAERHAHQMSAEDDSGADADEVARIDAAEFDAEHTPEALARAQSEYNSAHAGAAAFDAAHTPEAMVRRAQYNAARIDGAAAFDAAHASVNAERTAAAAERFADAADDGFVPYVETPAVQVAIAQITRGASIDRRDLEDYALALYRLIDGTPEGETVDPKIAAAYQRYIAAAQALFDARAALMTILINPDLENSAPYVGASKIARP